MVSTRKKRQSNRRLVSQLDDIDQHINVGNSASERQENIIVNEGTNDRDFTVSTSCDNLATNENTLNVKTLERCFDERIDREMSKFRSINASSGQDATSVTAKSGRGEHVGIFAFLKSHLETTMYYILQM